MIQRGSTLYNQLLFDDTLPSIEVQKERSGRNPILLSQRNEFLLHRIYFKSKIQGKQYPVAFAELQSEVYISAFMIQKIMQAHAEALLRIKKEKPSAKALAQKYPHFTW